MYVLYTRGRLSIIGRLPDLIFRIFPIIWICFSVRTWTWTKLHSSIYKFKDNTWWVCHKLYSDIDRFERDFTSQSVWVNTCHVLNTFLCSLLLLSCWILPLNKCKCAPLLPQTRAGASHVSLPHTVTACSQKLCRKHGFWTQFDLTDRATKRREPTHRETKLTTEGLRHGLGSLWVSLWLFCLSLGVWFLCWGAGGLLSLSLIPDLLSLQSAGRPLVSVPVSRKQLTGVSTARLRMFQCGRSQAAGAQAGS